MKKCVLWVLILVMLLSFAACGGAAQGSTGGEQAQGGNTDAYQVTQEQWEAAFGENGEVLSSAMANHTCHCINDIGMESVYKQIPEEDIYYENSISYEREYYYVRKADQVDIYVGEGGSWTLLPDKNWEEQRLNATDNLSYDMNYFMLTYDYNNAVFSEAEKAYIYTGFNSEVKVYFENGKLVRLVLTKENGAFSDYSQFGTTQVTLPENYEILS